MKKTLSILLAALILLSASISFAETAKQVDFLLNGYRHPTTDAILSGGKVKTYLDGTSTLSALYTDKDQGGTAANPVILGSDGRAEVFGDTIYKFEIYDSDDVLLETLNGLDYSIASSSAVSLNSAHGCDLAQAVTDIGATKTTIDIDCAAAVGEDVTIPATMSLNCLRGGLVTTAGTFTLTINGQVTGPAAECFAGAGTTTFSGDGPILGKWLNGGSDDFTGVVIKDTTVENTPIGGSTAAAGTFTDVTLNNLYHKKGTDAASATALDLTGDGNIFDITGTTTITSIDTKTVGSVVILQFDGALTLTHHSTNLVLPGGANITTAAGDSGIFYEYATGDWRCIGWTTASGEPISANTGGVVQVVNVMDGAVATGSTQIPADNTIPLFDEGDTYMTLAITPTSATNKLRIDVVWNGGGNAFVYMTAALFQDATGSDPSIAAVSDLLSINTLGQLVFTHYMTAGTTSEITFKVNAGMAGGTVTTFNGHSGARENGGVSASSITITEIQQ